MLVDQTAQAAPDILLRQRKDSRKSIGVGAGAGRSGQRHDPQDGQLGRSCLVALPGVHLSGERFFEPPPGRQHVGIFKHQAPASIPWLLPASPLGPASALQLLEDPAGEVLVCLGAHLSSTRTALEEEEILLANRA